MEERCIVCDEWMGEYCCMSCGNTEFEGEEDNKSDLFFSDDDKGDWQMEQRRDKIEMEKERTP